MGDKLDFSWQIPKKGRQFDKANDMERMRNEQYASYASGIKPIQQDLAKTCQATIDRHTAALRDVLVDINTKKLEAQRIEAEIDALTDRSEKLKRELAGARAAMVAMNSGGM